MPRGGGGVTVTDAVAHLLVSATLVAVTTTFEVTLMAGATSKPFVMLPSEVVQVTPVLLVLLTVALNCKVPEEATVAVVGEIVTDTGAPGAVTDTDTLADLVESATLVAVTVTFVLAVTAGAVNKPALVMLPEDAVHVTAVLVALLTVAVNC